MPLRVFLEAGSKPLIDAGDDALAKARAFYRELLRLEPPNSFVNPSIEPENELCK